MKTKVWKGIIIFVVFMVVFTIASRIIMQICTPTVEVVYAQMGNINKMVQEEAVVQGSREIAVITEQGIRISEVNVHQGSQVEKGELLYTYDMEHLKEKQKEFKNQIVVLDWQIADEQAMLQRMPEASATNLKQLNLSRKSLAEEKKVLDELIKNEGKVYAETGGQIVRVNLEVGAETTGSADIMMADDTNGKHAEVMVDREYRTYLTVGSNVLVDYTTELYGEAYQTTGDGTILAIEEELLPGALIVTVDLTQLDTNIGDYVYIKVVNVATDYTSVLPREALHYDGMDYFVYVVEEEETIMGLENRISKRKVEVLDMNESYVAVDQVSMLLPIVVDSDKQLAEDGRVRYAETKD